MIVCCCPRIYSDFYSLWSYPFGSWRSGDCEEERVETVDLRFLVAGIEKMGGSVEPLFLKAWIIVLSFVCIFSHVSRMSCMGGIFVLSLNRAKS